LLTGQAALYSAVVVEPGEVLAVPVGRVRDLLTKDAMLGDLILRSYLIRRSTLVGLGTAMRIIGSRYSPDVRRLRDFAARNRIPCRWADLEDDTGTESLLWYGDGTEIATGEGKLHLNSVLDMGSRRVLGFALGEHHDARLAYGALAMAAAVRGGQVPGVILHTDQGSEGVHRQSVPPGVRADGRHPVHGQARVVPVDG